MCPTLGHTPYGLEALPWVALHEITPEASSHVASCPVGPLWAFLDKREGFPESPLGREDWQLLQGLSWLIQEISWNLQCLEFIVMVTRPNQPSTGLVVCTGWLFLDYFRRSITSLLSFRCSAAHSSHPEWLPTVALL